LVNVAGLQGCQLTRWAWFGLGEKRNSDKGAAFMFLPPEIASNESA